MGAATWFTGWMSVVEEWHVKGWPILMLEDVAQAEARMR
jgi:hypothetical protein